MSQAANSSGFGLLGHKARQKLRSDNDIKIIIVGKNSQTGIGKTTLAIQLCRYIDPQWSANKKAFIDPRDYVNAHMNYPKGSALLLDEIEKAADSRRANSHENVELSQAWATLRARNIATVTTSPSVNLVDKRMMELADFWILVKKRGWAQPYEIKVNDFNGKISRQPLPGNEHIRFADLDDDDEDKEYLDSIKDEMLQNEGSKHIPKSEHQKKLKQAVRESKQEKRNELIQGLYHETDMSTTDLSNLECIGLSQSQISNIV